MLAFYLEVTLITDNLDNIKYYKIPKTAVDFIKNLNAGIQTGRKDLGSGVYANVETYQTKRISDAKFEAHKDYVDIQILLEGKEKIYYSGLSGLEIFTPYNREKDICFYSNPVINFPFVELNGRNFVVLFPHEAHAPQVSIDDNSQDVLKVVVKIPVKLFL